MRTHTPGRGGGGRSTRVEQWQELALEALGRRLVYAADEYYLLAGRPFPAADAYDGFPQHENGIGMARAFAGRLRGRRGGRLRGAARVLRLGRRGPGRRLPGPRGPTVGATSTGPAGDAAPRAGSTRSAVITGEYGAMVLGPLLAGLEPAPGRARSGCCRAQRLLRREHRRHRAAHRGRHRPGAGRGTGRGPRTCCPTSACREGRFLDGMTRGGPAPARRGRPHRRAARCGGPSRGRWAPAAAGADRRGPGQTPVPSPWEIR